MDGQQPKTEHVLTIREQIKEHGSIRKAARALGIPRSTLQDRLKRESEQDIAADIVPDGYRVRGTSTLFDKEGNVKLSWVKTQIDPERIAAILDEMREGFNSTLERELPCEYLSGLPSEKDLLTTYIITDYHFGMLAWHEETGADWDIEIAERGFRRYFDYAVSMTPSSETAVFANIGDILHFDGMLPVTPANKHVLDADTRFQKLIRVAIRSIRYGILKLLEKHKHVHIIHCCGNHDEASSAWLRETFAVFYENEPRVTVETRPDPYYCHEFGKTSLFFHHGHRRKIGNIDSVFAGKFRGVFGRTKFSYGHMGHLHSTAVEETNLMLIERHRTLAAPDAYASSGGWLSGRSSCAITYSRDYGEMSRVIAPWELLK